MIQIKNYTAGENQMIGFIKYINYKDGYGYISIPDRATLTQLIYMIVITIDLRISRHRKFYKVIFTMTGYHKCKVMNHLV